MRTFIGTGYYVVVIIDELVHEITLILSILQDMIDGNISHEFIYGSVKTLTTLY